MYPVSAVSPRGSPPLARRAPLADVVGEGELWVTSARAESTSPSSCRRWCGPGHLRSRGEHALHQALPDLIGGSPPLARRARCGFRPPRCGRGVTSARAESTGGTGPGPSRTTGHLRSRGEHARAGKDTVAAYGSPPLARRARARTSRADRPSRVTSARAESTGGAGRGGACCPGHLRSRGEHADPEAPDWPVIGSPPLARRAPPGAVAEDRHVRVTSARAESTDLGGEDGHDVPGHLRSRGEHPNVSATTAGAGGSPPLARRARGVVVAGHVGVRVTSARAESTHDCRRTAAPAPGHLRSRGEHVLVEGADVVGRVTSARAESTGRPWFRRGLRPGHLRSRGEHRGPAGCWHGCPGSPPLARRAPGVGVLEGCGDRVTSARAESTLPDLRFQRRFAIS